MADYVAAELAGKTSGGDGECWKYHKDCPKSLFAVKSRYSESANSRGDDFHVTSNMIGNDDDDDKNEVKGFDDEEKLHPNHDRRHPSVM